MTTPATDRLPRLSGRWVAIAGVLLLGSAALQAAASSQRWSHSPVEDHRFDYSYPADPWQNLGWAAQFFGVGYLLLAAGVLVLLRVSPLPAGSRLRVLERAVVIIAAASFAIDGGHALVSGLLGAPTVLQHVQLAQWALSLAAGAGLVVLGGLWLRRSPAVSTACLLLLGATVPGYLFAAFHLAPLISGYQSYDTTPGTEAVVAATTALAGVASLAAGLVRSARSGRESSPCPRARARR